MAIGTDSRDYKSSTLSRRLGRYSMQVPDNTRVDTRMRGLSFDDLANMYPELSSQPKNSSGYPFAPEVESLINTTTSSKSSKRSDQQTEKSSSKKSTPKKSSGSSKSDDASKSKSSGSTVESLKKGSAKSNAALNVATSIVDFLKSLGEDSSFSSRKQLAKKYGIEGEYTGSAEQNLAMLKAAKSSAGSSRPEDMIESSPKPMLGNDASSRPITMPDDNFRVKRMRPDRMPPTDMPEATDSIGKPVPASVDTEDMARMNIDRQLLDQNREFVTQQSLADGTWKSYTSFIKQMVRDGMSLQDLPNFREYSRVSPEQRSNDEYN